jgi:DNA replication protein DnaC
MATGLMAVHSLTIVDVKIDVLDQKLDAIQTEQLELDKAVKGTPDRILEALAGASGTAYIKLVEDSIAARKKENKIKVMKFFSAKQTVQTRSRPFEDQVPGTVSWLLKEDAYRKWRSKENTVLWLHGPPGIGKAYLAYGIFSDLTSVSRSDLPGSVAFASLKVEKESTSLKIALCSLASQIAEEDSNYCDAVAEELKEMTGTRAYEELNLDDAWTKFFSTKFKKDSSSHAYLILDSLFKKADTSEIDRFGKFLSEIARDKLQLLVVVTASTEPKVVYPSLEALKIEINSEAMQLDVTMLIQYRCGDITGLPNIRAFSQDTKTKIVDNLGEKSADATTILRIMLTSTRHGICDVDASTPQFG